MFGGNLGLHKLEQVRSFLKRRRANFFVDLRLRPSDGTVLATVPSASIEKRAGKGKTSLRQLQYIRKAIDKELGINLEFLVSMGEELGTLESGLRLLLESRFPNDVADCFISLSRARLVDVWIDLAHPLSVVSSDKMKQLSRAISDYFKLYEMEIGHIDWGGMEKEPPSPVAILRAIKKAAPAPVHTIKRLLEDGGFSIPSASWIERKLDVLRKQNTVLRQENGSYVLTDIGLRSVPHGAYRSSSDIERALALGRKKW